MVSAGLSYSKVHRASEALAAFKRAISLRPNESKYWFLAAQADELIHNDGEALENYRKAVDLDPSLAVVWERLSLLTSDPKEKATAAEHLLSLNPQDVGGTVQLGTYQYQHGNWAGAETYFRKATALVDNSPVLWSDLGLALLNEKKNSEAVPAFEKAIQYGSSLPPEQLAAEWFHLAMARNFPGFTTIPPNCRGILEAINHATALAPNDAHYWYVKFACEKQLSNLYEAKAALAKCQQLGGVADMGDSRTLMEWHPKHHEDSDAANKITHLLSKNEKDQAMDAAQEELRNHPESPVAWYSLGQVLLSQKRYIEAIEALNKATAINPNVEVITSVFMGDCLFHQGKFDEAIQVLTKSVNFFPDLDVNWSLLARCYDSKKDLVASELKIRSLVQAHTGSPYGWDMLGIVLLKEGKIADAIPAFRKAVDIKPNFPEALSNLGAAYEKTRQYDYALKNLQLALAADSKCSEALCNRGYIYYLLGQFDKAIADDNRALSIYSKYPQALTNLTAAYAKTKQWDLARETCARLRKLDPKAGEETYQYYLKSAPAGATSPASDSHR